MPRRTGRMKIPARNVSAGWCIVRSGRDHDRALNDHRGRNHTLHQIDNIRCKANPAVVSMSFPGKSGSGGEDCGDGDSCKKFFRIHNAHPFSQQSFRLFLFFIFCIFSAFMTI